MRGYRAGEKSYAIIAAARRLRREATPEEKILWKALRSRRFAGLKFRRQYPFDAFVIDCYCPSRKLAIELDGSQHYTADGLAYDAERTAYLEGVGITVLRFANKQVHQELAAVLASIENATGPGGQ
jgi:very-short-patch-repair endonuclease